MGEQTERESVCDACGAENSIQRTVSWQPDICTACGADVPADT